MRGGIPESESSSTFFPFAADFEAPAFDATGGLAFDELGATRGGIPSSESESESIFLGGGGGAAFDAADFGVDFDEAAAEGLEVEG